MHIYAYNNGSASAKALSERLNVKRAKHEGKRLKTDVLINWGASKIDRDIAYDRILNHPDAVTVACNKLSTFQVLKANDVNIPEFTSDKAVVEQWLNAGETVFARTKLNAHSGDGIVAIDPDVRGAIPEAKLYVKYIRKTEEYRFHVTKDYAFFIQRKARNKDIPDEKVNWQIRNHGNGFIYAHQDVNPKLLSLRDAERLAVRSLNAVGLDFGAVDIIYNSKEKKFYVLEINTACGLEGTTLDKYVEMFKEI